MKENREQKIFISPYVSLRFHYQAVVFLFVMLPVGILYMYLLGVRSMNFELTVMSTVLTIAVFVPFILLAAGFLFIRKYLPFKIVIDESSLKYVGLMKTVRARWSEIEAIRVLPMGRGVFEIRTKNGTFYFPVIMKELNAEYPKLRNDGITMKWTYSDGSERTVAPENSPVYIEISQQLKDNQVSINIT